MKNQKGFSLVELMIVVVIVGILATIAVPNLLSARRAANEGAAISSVRMLHGAEVVYWKTDGNGQFADNLTELHNRGYISQAMSLGVKSGYSLELKTDPSGRALFAIGAVPVTTEGLMKTGTQKFCVAVDGLMRADRDESRLGVNIANVDACSAVNYNTVVQ